MTVTVFGYCAQFPSLLSQMPEVSSVGAACHSVRQLADRLLQPLATTVDDICVFSIMLKYPLFPFAPVYIFPGHWPQLQHCTCN